MRCAKSKIIDIVCILFVSNSLLSGFQYVAANSGELPKRRATQRFAADRCVFILATPISGSTALMDALNQIPNYLIRGESWAAQFNLYNSYERLNAVARGAGQQYIDWNEYKHASFHAVKSIYDAHASRHKLPFFTEFQTDRVVIATRLFYNVLYGHYGDGVVSGFKETRYVCGQKFHSLRCPAEFTAFMLFLRKLCLNVKVLLLTRGQHSPDAYPEFFEHIPDGLRHKAADDMQHTHEVFDEYAANFPEHALRVHMENMFDPGKNATEARTILSFLEEDPSLPIRFTRMPMVSG